MTEFSPSSNDEDLAAAQRFIRTRSDAALIQISEAPQVLVTRLLGFTNSHLNTADERVVVGLALNEMERRNGRKTRRVAWFAFVFSVLSFVLAALTLILSQLDRIGAAVKWVRSIIH
jgi:hypothetical protein